MIIFKFSAVGHTKESCAHFKKTSKTSEMRHESSKPTNYQYTTDLDSFLTRNCYSLEQKNSTPKFNFDNLNCKISKVFFDVDNPYCNMATVI